MPRKRTSKRPTKRKFVRRPKRKAARTTLVNRSSISPIAPRYITKLHYAEVVSLGSGAGSLANCQVFNLNSLFDPDLTGVGHQPYGFDQIAGLYSRYRVFSVSWVIRARPGAVAGIWGVIPTNGVATLNGFNASYIMELPRGIHKEIDGSSPTMIRGHVSLPNLNGVLPSVYKADDRFQAITNASPTELMTLQLWTSASATTAQIFDVELTYHCEFFDPAIVTGS